MQDNRYDKVLAAAEDLVKTWRTHWSFKMVEAKMTILEIAVMDARGISPKVRPLPKLRKVG
jgi:hypothetical protein